MKNYIYIALITFFMLSCTRHEDIIDTSFQHGNILLSNGNVIHPSVYNKEKDKAIGVVFWCNKDKDPKKAIGYAVSLQDIGTELLVNTTDNISSVSESEIDFDGESNTAGIITYAMKDSIECQAATLAMDYDPGMKGWYIGSVAQQKAISQNITKIYESFRLIDNSEPFTGWYWTSTENGAGKETPQISAFIISLENGSLGACSKKEKNKVRPIITIR